MADTTTRTLKLLALLQAHRLWSAIELADRLGTTERTVRRDVERLRELGYPVESVRGTGGGYQLAPGGSLPPLVVDEEEAVAIVSALRTAASGSAAGLAEASVRALAKVMQVLPPKLQRRADALRAMSVVLPGEYQAPPIDAETLTTVALACRDATELTFTYAPGERSGSAPGARRTEPLRLVPVGRRWYLLAYDLDRQDWRTFRLDRMRDVAPTTWRFRPRQHPDPVAYVQRSVTESPYRYIARIRLRADADQVRDMVPPQVGRVEDDEDGWCVLVVGADDPDWVVMHVARMGFEAVVLEPPELRAAADRLATRLAAIASRSDR